MKGQEKRRMNERSLKNLELGSESRKLGKVRHNFTLMPESVNWLKETGNASDAIDSLVKAARSGELKSSNTHEWNKQEQVQSNDVYEQEIKDLKRDLEETQLELQKTRSLLETSKRMEQSKNDLLCECHSDAFKAADILKAALKLKSNAGGAIKREIEKALPLIDDV